MDTHIGAGGWAYFRVPGMDNLEAYSKGFGFVEVNSTYYWYPHPSKARAWRKAVPDSFSFAVRANRELAEKYEFDVEKAKTSLEKLLALIGELRAGYVHLLVPQASAQDPNLPEKLTALFPGGRLGQARVVVEIRPRTSAPAPSLLRAIQDLGAIQCVDLSLEQPEVQGEVLYTRLFGVPEGNTHQFLDEELERVRTRAEAGGYQEGVFVFHGVRMYVDTARFRHLVDTGEHGKATSRIGLESLGEVLAVDATFPTTRDALLRGQGWKVVDRDETTRVRAEYYLEKLPQGLYGSAGSVMGALQKAGIH